MHTFICRVRGESEQKRERETDSLNLRDNVSENGNIV